MLVLIDGAFNVSVRASADGCIVTAPPAAVIIRNGSNGIKFSYGA